MGLETATSIAALNALWPLGTDPRSQGDDHLRLIKSVLQADAVRKGGDTMTGVLTIAQASAGGATASLGSRSVNFQRAAGGTFSNLFVDEAANLVAFRRDDAGVATGINLRSDRVELQVAGVFPLTAVNNRITVLAPAGGSAANAYLDPSGNLLKVGSLAAWKRDIRDVSGCLAAVLALRPREFRWNTDHPEVFDDLPDEVVRGFVHEEVKAVLPVAAEEDGYSINAMVATIVGALHELFAQLDALEARAGAPGDASAA